MIDCKVIVEPIIINHKQKNYKGELVFINNNLN